MIPVSDAAICLAGYLSSPLVECSEDSRDLFRIGLAQFLQAVLDEPIGVGVTYLLIASAELQHALRVLLAGVAQNVADGLSDVQVRVAPE